MLMPLSLIFMVSPLVEHFVDIQKNIVGGLGLSQCDRCPPRSLEQLGLFDHPFELVAEVCNVQRLPARTLFDDNLCVSSLLSRNGIDDDHRKSQCHGFGRSESSGFRYQNIGGAHELMDVLNEAENPRFDIMGIAGSGSPLLQLFVSAAHEPEGEPLLGEYLKHCRDF